MKKRADVNNYGKYKLQISIFSCGCGWVLRESGDITRLMFECEEKNTKNQNLKKNEKKYKKNIENETKNSKWKENQNVHLKKFRKKNWTKEKLQKKWTEEKLQKLKRN